METFELNYYTEKYIEHEAEKECYWFLDKEFKSALADLKSAEQLNDKNAILFYKAKVKQLDELLKNIFVTNRYLLLQRELAKAVGVERARQHIDDISQELIRVKAKSVKSMAGEH